MTSKEHDPQRAVGGPLVPYDSWTVLWLISLWPSNVFFKTCPCFIVPSQEASLRVWHGEVHHWILAQRPAPGLSISFFLQAETFLETILWGPLQLHHFVPRLPTPVTPKTPPGPPPANLKPFGSTTKRAWRFEWNIFFFPTKKTFQQAVPAPLNLFYVFSGDNVDQCLQKHLQWYLSPLFAFMVLDGISERFFLWQMFEDFSCKCYCCRSDTATASSSAPAEQFGSNEVSLGLLLFSHKVGLLLSLPWNRSREVGTGC